MNLPQIITVVLAALLINGCGTGTPGSDRALVYKSASQILGDTSYEAVCYGGYRGASRDSQPTLAQIKEDLRILNSMNIRLLRTYNVQYPEAENILLAIKELKEEIKGFEMYVMLGAWINCKNAWSSKQPDHSREDLEANTAEMNRVVALANKYPETVRFISVGNEARVKWATSYFVQTPVILKWVQHLQMLKKEGLLDTGIWITSSDNFASWGGGDSSYHSKELEELIRAVDFVSLHTYPMHDTHYNPSFWGISGDIQINDKIRATDSLMEKAVQYARNQYFNTVKYIHRVQAGKQVHIGETGWASYSDGFYGREGSKACDEYKAGVYYRKMMRWARTAGITCFYFEAFDEKWKDAMHPAGSENHFGLFTINGKAKYAIWERVDQDKFKGLKRDGNPVEKSHEGNLNKLLKQVDIPISTNRDPG